MEKKLVYGIQQFGIGLESADEAFAWYGSRFGSDLVVFDEEADAVDMAPFMGGEVRSRYAILAMNINGGSGLELWQYTKRKPHPPESPILMGDYGINTIFFKTRDIQKTFERFQESGEDLLSDIRTDPKGKKYFWLRDPYGNLLGVKEFDSWFKTKNIETGGPFSSIIGVSDIENSRKLYSDILGYTELIYDVEETFGSLEKHGMASGSYRRVLLGHPQSRHGGFAKLYGKSQIELVQRVEGKAKRVYENRFWGDIGFIHVCFDVRHMDSLVAECKSAGFEFDVLSSPDFDMGDAAGRFGYIQDPDGTLVEFVETYKVPLVKALKLGIDLRKRDPNKCLPTWLIGALRFTRKSTS